MASTSAVHIKLLTLLNVSTTKRPQELDLPGGSRRRTLSHSPIPLPAPSPEKSDATAGEGVARKKRKGISWGGEIGPSGSGLKEGGKKQKQNQTQSQKEVKVVNVNGKGKGKGKASDRGVPIILVNQEEVEDDEVSNEINFHADGDDSDEDEGAEDGMKKSASDEDTFNSHFAISPPILTPEAQSKAEALEWSTRKKVIRGLGKVVEYTVGEGSSSSTGTATAASSHEMKSRVTPQLLNTFSALHPDPSPTLAASLSVISGYQDLFAHGLDGDADGTGKGGFGPVTESVRAAATMHALNHVMKTGRRIMKNNEKLAHGSTSADFDARDQSFVRPKVLLLLPTRSLALHYLENHLFPLAPEDTQIENRKPFISSFSLPEEVADPLEEKDASKKYTADHIATFKGNSDDSFRFGIKLTRKAWRVILPPANEEKIIGCDIIVASPLGLRMAADKEGGADSLSSVEVLIADGLDVMAMQNWDHVQFVFSNLNKIPNNPHGCDFSRVKPWYLDQQARFLRQSILLSRFETPEIRALFTKSLQNVAGKIRLETPNYPGVLTRVKRGVKQVFEKIPGNDPVEELDARFDYFVKTTLPALLKSAVSRTNTLIMVPSYFDFIRVVNHFRKLDNVTYAAISEYASNAEISAARTAFFKGKKSFLIMTERFHFYRRYKIRGARTLVFYALPDHAIFYPELVASPFLPSATGVQTHVVDPEEVNVKVAFSKWDYMKLARIVGSEDARRMIKDGETKFTFV